jgi:hypothetical protein
MKQIELTQGQVAIVDDWWYDELNQYKWFAARWRGAKSFYAVRNSKSFLGKKTIVLMHAVIAGTPKGMKTDHQNRNTLDNREENLRVCTNSQNHMNSGKHADNTSGYKGVYKFRRGWRALIGINGKLKYLGAYSTTEEAARAYDEAAKRLHGKFAILNFEEK